MRRWWMCIKRGLQGAFLHNVPFAEVGAPQVLCEEEIQYTLVSETMYLLFWKYLNMDTQSLYWKSSHGIWVLSLLVDLPISQ